MEVKTRWKEYEGKNIYLELKNGRRYSGSCVQVDDNTDIIFISFKDKFGSKVTVVTSEIKFIEVER